MAGVDQTRPSTRVRQHRDAQGRAAIQGWRDRDGEVFRPERLAPPWRRGPATRSGGRVFPVLHKYATPPRFLFLLLNFRCHAGNPQARSTMVDFCEPRWFIRSRFHNEQCQLDDSFQNIFTRLGQCATTRNKGRRGNSSLSPRIRHAALAAPARTAWFSTAVSPCGSASRPKPEPPRDSTPGSPARRPRSGSADRSRQHRRSLASEEHICGLTSPARPDATR
jgi:hypothetical protein